VDTHVAFLEFVLVGSRSGKRSFTGVTLLAKDVQEDIGVSAST
jgi:hypothetical protein